MFFYEAFEKLRKDKGFTQPELAAAMDPPVDPSTIFRWKKGSATPSASRIRQLAKVLEVDPAELTDDYWARSFSLSPFDRESAVANERKRLAIKKIEEDAGIIWTESFMQAVATMFKYSQNQPRI